MKKMNKILLSILAVFAFALVLKMPVQAATLNMNQTACTPRTVTVQWTNLNQAYNGSSETRVTKYELETQDGVLPLTTFSGNTTSAVISNLPASYLGYARIKAYYTVTNYYSNGYSYSYSYTDTLSNVRICTLPPTVQKKHFVVKPVTSSTVSVNVAKTNSSYTAHLQVYQGSKCVVNNATYNGGSFSIKKNTVYKYRVKYSYKNTQNGKIYESANWSPWRYFSVPSISGKAKSNKKGFTLTLKRTAGVSSYKVYISKKYASGYKLSTTVKLGSKKKKTVTITKNRKKRATNYVRIVPQIKGYGPSDLYTGGNIYVYK